MNVVDSKGMCGAEYKGCHEGWYDGPTNATDAEMKYLVCRRLDDSGVV
jgi:hypothetical protein